MNTLTNVELNPNLSEPVVFFEFNGTNYALLVGGSEKVLTGEMDGIDDELNSQMVVTQDWDNESTTFEFDDFIITYSNNSVSAELI